MQTGKVIKVINSNAKVFVPKDASCDGCHSCGVCTAKGQTVLVSNEINAKEGDFVQIDEGKGPSILFSALVFICPILLPVIFYVALSKISEILAVSGVIGSLLIWVIALYFVNKKIKNDAKITKIISSKKL